jgi:hypothetical protein
MDMDDALRFPAATCLALELKEKPQGETRLRKKQPFAITN